MIDIKTPMTTEWNQVVNAHDKAVEDSVADWVLILDHDVYLACRRKWFQLLGEGIKQVDKNETGIITCVTGDRRRYPQKADIKNVKYDENIKTQENIAEQLYQKHGSKIVNVTDHHIASFFMLINRETFKHVKFNDNEESMEDNFDHLYAQRMLDAGYKIYVMPGLYVYHRKHGSKIHKR